MTNEPAMTEELEAFYRELMTLAERSIARGASAESIGAQLIFGAGPTALPELGCCTRSQQLWRDAAPSIVLSYRREGRPMPTKKSPAQLQREIDEALASKHDRGVLGGLGKRYLDAMGHVQYGVDPRLKAKINADKKAAATTGLQGVRNAIANLAPGVEEYITERDGKITLHEIQVPKDLRGEGVGSRAMKLLIEYADKTGQRILLTPDTSYGASSKGRLERFYAQFGFKKNKGRHKDYSVSEGMIRKPL